MRPRQGSWMTAWGVHPATPQEGTSAAQRWRSRHRQRGGTTREIAPLSPPAGPPISDGLAVLPGDALMIGIKDPHTMRPRLSYSHADGLEPQASGPLSLEPKPRSAPINPHCSPLSLRSRSLSLFSCYSPGYSLLNSYFNKYGTCSGLAKEALQRWRYRTAIPRRAVDSRSQPEA